MFPKAVLGSHKRGLRPMQAYNLSKIRLERWAQGEREELWGELPTGVKARRRAKQRDEKEALEVMGRLAELGAPAKAVQNYLSPGVAGDTKR